MYNNYIIIPLHPPHCYWDSNTGPGYPCWHWVTGLHPVDTMTERGRPSCASLVPSWERWQTWDPIVVSLDSYHPLIQSLAGWVCQGAMRGPCSAPNVNTYSCSITACGNKIQTWCINWSFHSLCFSNTEYITWYYFGPQSEPTYTM